VVRAGRFLAGRPRSLLLLIGVLGVLLVGLIDRLTGLELSFSILYLLPIGLLAWFGDRRSAVFLSGLAALTWFAVDHLSGVRYVHPLLAYWNAVVRLGFFLAVSYLLPFRTELGQERRLSRFDALTGVPNHRHFVELAERELYRSRRYQRPLSVAYIDVDDFKQVNDRHGHAAGDALLRALADQICRNVRASDVVGRLGGDEFAILLPETESEAAKAVLRKLQQRLRDPAGTAGMPVTLSIGAVSFRTLPPSTAQLIGWADRLMYQVKRGHKDDLAHAVV
jgi:diguanylate cyclase (GGDEF)-like protein